jgi:hypothetical protein
MNTEDKTQSPQSAETVDFLFDPASGTSFTVERESPDPEFLDKLIGELIRQRKELLDLHRVLIERMFRVSQLWLAGTALFAAGGLLGSMRSAWWLAACYACGFALSLSGQRARQASPLGIGASTFNDWRQMRASTTDNLEVWLSTMEVVLESAAADVAWRARWLNISLAALAVFTVLAMASRALGMA